MKVIELKSIPASEKEPALDYLDMIREVVRRAPRDGYGFEDIPKANRVLRALDEAGGSSLSLEDADHAFLVQRVKAFRWPISSYSIEDFNNDVIQAKAVKKEKVEKSEVAE